MLLPLLASLSFAAEAPPLAEPARAEALPTNPPARVLDPERVQDFERFHRRAQIAESALLFSYLGYVPLVLSLFARGSNADPMGPVGSALVGVPAPFLNDGQPGLALSLSF